MIGGGVRLELDWPDRDAGFLGFSLEVPSLVLGKGDGSVVGALSVNPGAMLRGQLAAHHVPLSSLDALGSLASTLDGRANAIIEVGGRLDEMTAEATVTLSPIRIGAATLGGSALSVRLVPTPKPPKSQGKTGCGRLIPEAFDLVEFAKDPVDGIFHVQGDLFAGQAKLEDVQVTQQRSRSVRGAVHLDQLDLGAISHLSPVFAMSDNGDTHRTHRRRRARTRPSCTGESSRGAVPPGSRLWWVSRRPGRTDCRGQARRGQSRAFGVGAGSQDAWRTEGGRRRSR